jgi:protein CpxP
MNEKLATVAIRTPSRQSLKRVVMAVALALAAVAAMPMAHAAPHAGGGMHGMHGPMGFRGSPERIDRMVDHMLGGINVTDSQRTQVKQIAQAAATDLRAQREAGRELRQRAMQLFAQPTVDATAVEALRQQQMAHMNQVSKRVSEAMIEISRVLTPEQRLQMAEHMKQRAERMRERAQRRQAEPAPSAPAR